MYYSSMCVVNLKALPKDRGLRGYSRLKKTELITFLQNNLRPRTRPPRPTRPPPPPPQSVRFRLDRPRQPELLRQLGERQRQPSSQEINISEQQEMSKSRSQVTSKLNDWYDWLVNHVPKTIKDKASKAFKTFKDKVIGSYNRVTGNEDQTRQKKIEELKGPRKPEESFNPIEREQAFSRAYRSYRINGRPRMDVDTFFNRIRQNLIGPMNREVTDLGSARVHTTAWIRFR